jgi:hypothetical protein
MVGGPQSAPALVACETHPLLPHAGDPFVDSKYACLAGEDLVEQHAVDLSSASAQASRSTTSP